MPNSNIIKMMKKANRTFTSVTSHSISFMDNEGNPVLPFNMDIFSDFCEYVINSDKGSKKCIECNDIIENGMENRKSRIFRCHMGLTMIAVPIVISGYCHYSITCGQMLRKGEQEDFFLNLKDKSRKLDLDIDKLVKLGNKVQVITEKEIETRSVFLSMLAEYISIAETQLELNKKYSRELETKIKLEKNLRETQFRFLQAQISPHFLFNNLNLLARVAQKEDADKTSNLIYNLSDLLRRSFKNANSSCTLEEEFHHIKSYLNLQQVRYSGFLDNNVFLEKKIADIDIPIFCIQPFVENAIIHGIEPIERKGEVTVTAVKDRDQVQICVSDNGAGMDKETIETIMKGQSKPSRIQASGMGIRNVLERLKLYYNDQYDFKIQSTQDNGTRVSVFIPILEKGGKIKYAQDIDS